MYGINEIKKSAAYIKEKIDIIPDTAIILGSGLGSLTDDAKIVCEIKYSDIPYFKTSTAPSHEGKLVFAYLNDNYVLMLKGRLHYYEGYTFEETTYPIKVLKMIGVKNLLVTNAAGGINESFSEGDFMMITDHIKLSALNPLRGENIDELGPRFNDMTNAYDADFQNIIRESARKSQIDLKEGVYAFMSGPCYETKAEVRALKILGADAVGMSTVAEVIVANHCKMRVMGISCITNMAAGITGNALSEDKVLKAGKKVENKFKILVTNILKLI